MIIEEQIVAKMHEKMNPVDCPMRSCYNCSWGDCPEIEGHRRMAIAQLKREAQS